MEAEDITENQKYDWIVKKNEHTTHLRKNGYIRVTKDYIYIHYNFDAVKAEKLMVSEAIQRCRRCKIPTIYNRDTYEYQIPYNNDVLDELIRLDVMRIIYTSKIWMDDNDDSIYAGESMDPRNVYTMLMDTD